METPRFITIEGGDGSGKETQTKLLIERMRKAGYNVLDLSFPRYDNSSALLVKGLLSGQFGEMDQVDPTLRSLPFAVDRAAARHEISDHLSNNPTNIVVSDRYVFSNLAHNGSSITHQKQRLVFYDEMRQVEFDHLGVVKPDLNIILAVAPENAATLMKERATLASDLSRDMYEEDQVHQSDSRLAFIELADAYPDETSIVDCNPDGRLRSREAIHDEVAAILKNRGVALT